jgi:hypothetical protein
MTLTIKEIDAIRNGEPVRTCVPEVGADCIVVRADVFERAQRLLEEEWSDDEHAALAARTMADADTAGPIE